MSDKTLIFLQQFLNRIKHKKAIEKLIKFLFSMLFDVLVKS